MTRYAFKVGDHPSLVVRVAAGRLDIGASSDGEISVEVSGSGAEFVIVEQVGDTTYIREERRLFSGRSVNIRAAVPVGSTLEAGAASLDIVARVDLGRVLARTASGDLDFGQVASIEAKSASGDVKVGSCAGRCEVGSASGDVRIQRVAGDLTASTASGDISVERADGRIEAKTASGDVRVGVCTGPAVEVSSMSGDVDLGLVAGTRIEAEIDSLSGDITLPPRRPPGGKSEQSLRLRAKTVSGDVIVRRITL